MNSEEVDDLPVRRIAPQDLWEALRKGRDDFYARPTHGIFLCVIYPLTALVSIRLGLGYGMLPLIFPLLVGFALVGPLAACGLYELSRRREGGQDYAWWHVFDVLRAPSRWALAALGIVMVGIFAAWLQTALLVYELFFGAALPESVAGFVQQLFGTREGWSLIALGCGLGFLFALVVFSISVVSLPMLLERRVSAGKAVAISVRAVLHNPRTMALWGLVVAGLLVLGSLPLFFGLAIAMPVLGHATWHLYRRVVV
ncbi:MAG: DUF2189 domain-containing protein [Pseudomonadales bacterium]|nr:DUF2189 domain-containing protein [Pseudomonadales bacterium]